MNLWHINDAPADIRALLPLREDHLAPPIRWVCTTEVISVGDKPSETERFWPDYSANQPAPKGGLVHAMDVGVFFDDPIPYGNVLVWFFTGNIGVDEPEGTCAAERAAFPDQYKP